MKHRLRTRVSAAAVMIVAAGAAAVPSTPAYAAVESHNLVSETINTSDPAITPCFATNFSGLCLYTSSDDNQSGIYPMTKTRLFTLQDGLDPSVESNWVNRGVVVDESTYANGMFRNHKHLWAPEGVPGFDGSANLFVPDVTNASNRYSSVITLARSSSLFSLPYQFVTTLNIPGYASDPSYMQEMSGQRWLLFADGDTEGDGPGPASNGRCGGFSIAPLANDLASVGTVKKITFESSHANWPAGTQSCNSNNWHPYMEGGSLYWMPLLNQARPYVIIFPFAPNPNVRQSIGYATSDRPDGVYTFEKVLMGPSSTEYTNQASIAQNPLYANTGDPYHLLFFYHDGPSGGNARRKVRAECMTYSPNGLNPVSRTPHSNSAYGTDADFVNCVKPPPTNCPATVASHLLGASRAGAQWATNSTFTYAGWRQRQPWCNYFGLIHTSPTGGQETTAWGNWSAFQSSL